MQFENKEKRLVKNSGFVASFQPTIALEHLVVS